MNEFVYISSNHICKYIVYIIITKIGVFKHFYKFKINIHPINFLFGGKNTIKFNFNCLIQELNIV